MRCAPAPASNASSTIPTEGWTARALVERRALEAFPNVNFSDPRVKLGGHDRRRAAGHRARPRRQRRVLAEPRARRLGQARLDAQQPALPATATIPGASWSATSTATALADLVYVDDAQVTLWINQSGNALERADRDPRHAAGLRHGRGAPGRPARHRRQRRAVERRCRRAVARPTCSFSTSPAASSRTCSTRWTTTWAR